MKKFILFLIAIFCIGSFATIEAKPTSRYSTRYVKYQRTYKKNVRKMQKKSYKSTKCVSARDFGKFRSNLTGKVYNGRQSLSYINAHKKKCY